jgi:hypothetical protein
MPPSKAAAGPPVFAIVTQGKTEHLVTIIDETVLIKLQKGTEFSKLKEEKIIIKWHSTGAKQPIRRSSMKLSDMMGGGTGGGEGRRASRRGSLGSAAAAAVVTATAAVTKRKRHEEEEGTQKPKTNSSKPATVHKKVATPTKKMKAPKKTEQFPFNSPAATKKKKKTTTTKFPMKTTTAATKKKTKTKMPVSPLRQTVATTAFGAPITAIFKETAKTKSKKKKSTTTVAAAAPSKLKPKATSTPTVVPGKVKKPLKKSAPAAKKTTTTTSKNPKPVMVWISQGGTTEHLATIVDPAILAVVAKKSSANRSLASLFPDKDAEMDIKWQSTDRIEPVFIEYARWFEVEERAAGGGRRSARSRR